MSVWLQFSILLPYLAEEIPCSLSLSLSAGADKAYIMGREAAMVGRASGRDDVVQCGVGGREGGGNEIRHLEGRREGEREGGPLASSQSLSTKTI